MGRDKEKDKRESSRSAGERERERERERESSVEIDYIERERLGAKTITLRKTGEFFSKKCVNELY